MTNRIVTSLCVLCAILSAIQRTSAQGSLTPPGAPAPTMLTLSQIEPRTPITNTTAATISASGSYYLTADIAVTNGSGVTITASGVTLDLNGFSISSTAATANGAGVVANNVHDLHVRNGHVIGTTTWNGSSYTGGGFNRGINCPGTNVWVTGVTVYGVAVGGVVLQLNNNTVVESCTVNVAGGNGIGADVVANSVAYYCGSVGILAGTAENCIGSATASEAGLNASIAAHNCSGTSVNGIGLITATAGNCYGVSTNGVGLSAQNANNCYGVSSTGYGLFANEAAVGCYGQSGTGVGLNATTASSCSGISNNNWGLFANTANNSLGQSINNDGVHCQDAAANCVGFSYSLQYDSGLYAYTAQNCVGVDFFGGNGLYVSTIAVGCFGQSYSGVGINTAIANSSYGLSGSGTGLVAYIGNSCVGILTNNTTSEVVANKYNMP